MSLHYQRDGITLYRADCLELMPSLAPNSVDTIITDPPYGIDFQSAEWDHDVPGPLFWSAMRRIAKPGALLLAFGGTRTHHRLMCAIEDAGWELRDCLMWLYGQGFNKVGLWKNNKAFQRLGIAEAWDGWGGSLRPAWEPIILAMNPRKGTFANNAAEYGVAGLWIDGCRIGLGHAHGNGREGEASAKRTYATRGGTSFSHTPGSRGGDPRGRWPTNLLLDEKAACMLDDQTGILKSGATVGGLRRQSQKTSNCYGRFDGIQLEGDVGYGDSGGASRFFYCAKASRSERTCRGRIKNDHPTVKPVALMRHLVRLTKTPTGGVVFDPFSGSGATAQACIEEGRTFIGADIDEHACTIMATRCDCVFADMES